MKFQYKNTVKETLNGKTLKNVCKEVIYSSNVIKIITATAVKSVATAGG